MDYIGTNVFITSERIIHLQDFYDIYLDFFPHHYSYAKRMRAPNTFSLSSSWYMGAEICSGLAVLHKQKDFSCILLKL